MTKLINSTKIKKSFTFLTSITNKSIALQKEGTYGNRLIYF